MQRIIAGPPRVSTPEQLGVKTYGFGVFDARSPEGA